MCEDPSAPEWNFQYDEARALMARLADLRAAHSVYDLVNLNLLPSDNLKSNDAAIQLSNSCTLRFSCNHQLPPLDEKGAIDWSKVHRIILLEVTR